MSSRKRRHQQEESPSAEQPDVMESVEQQPRRKRRSSAAATPPAAAGADSDADNNAGAAAAAAAAGGGGGDAAPPPRDRQPRVQFSQEEEAVMTETIKRLEEEGEAAKDRAAAMDLPPASLDAAVSRVVRFVLFRHHEKPGVPIKRQDINDVISGTAGVGKGSKASKKLPGLVLPLASAKLATAFGMELRELKRGDTEAAAAAAAAAAGAGAGGAAAAAAGGGGTAAAAAGGGTQTYKLLSMLPTELLTHCTQHQQDDQERGFVTTVLALLQLKQYRMDEDELWRHLGQLGIEREDPDAAEPFGGRHPTKILESMEHGRYLVKARAAARSSERGVLISYEWGEAAHSEFGGGVLDSVVSQFLKAGQDADDADDDS